MSDNSNEAFYPWYREERWYMLNDRGEPVPAPDVFTWGRSMEKSERRVARTELPDGRIVSTVFLGLDHGFGGGPPILWETMVFEKEGVFRDLEMDRCSGSREQAEAMHQRMVDRVSVKEAVSP